MGIVAMPEFDYATQCGICRRTLGNREISRDANFHYLDCPSCGSYRYLMVDANLFDRISEVDRGRLAGVLKRLSEFRNDRIQVEDGIVDALLAQAPDAFDVTENARSLLRSLGDRSGYVGAWTTFSSTVDRPLAYAATDPQLGFTVAHGSEQGWYIARRVGQNATLTLEELEHDVQIRAIEFKITPAGWEVARRRPRTESTKAFVAMWFDETMREPYDRGVREAIRNDCGYQPIRIDVEEYNGDIVDQVLAEINESRFVVADLTGHRNGVYFEAGYAMGQGVPVIWTCRAEAGRGTHFDAEHFNQIRWNDPADLRSKLQARIRATIGKGPLAAEPAQ
jgi:hypothetical protein